MFDGTFHDDDGSVFEGDIEWLAASGVTRGCNPPVNDRFCPNDDVTRGQMAAFLVRALELPDGTSNAFDDDDGSVFEANIDALAAAGIASGCGPRRFCPNGLITRGQMAAFLHRALDGRLPLGTPVAFDDISDSIFRLDIEWLGATGVTRGCSDDRFCPGGLVTRGQMAAFLHRALG